MNNYFNDNNNNMIDCTSESCQQVDESSQGACDCACDKPAEPCCDKCKCCACCKCNDGNDGKDGADGKDGVDGIDGVDGKDGEKGEKGDKGERGDQGATGFIGEKGDAGETGPKGDTGEKGEKGERGDQGIQGLQGLQGETGQKGDTGEKGEKGERGDTGATGLQGEKGDAGETGQKGDTGEKGEKGERGDTGATGETGATGPKGDTGAQGIQGVQGVVGPQGVAGVQGPAGPQGPQGCGIPGPTGATGASGPAGECCDPTCSTTVGQLVTELSAEQTSILSGEEASLEQALVEVYSVGAKADDEPLLKEVLFTKEDYGSLIQFTSDNLSSPRTNIVPVCSINSVIADITTTIGEYLVSYDLPSYSDSSTCQTTSDFIDFFTYYFKFCADNAINIVVGDGEKVEFTDAKLLAVSDGLIKIEYPFAEPTNIAIVSMCDIARVHYEPCVSSTD